MGQPPAASPPRRAGRPRSTACDVAILDAALDLLARHGFARMSMDAVAAAAGVSKATLYLRHPSKAELATAALAHLRETVEPPVTGDLRADLVARLESAAAYAADPSVMPLVGTCLAEEATTPELLALLRQRNVAPRRESLAALFHHALRRGELRADLDVEVAVDLVLGAYQARHLSGGAATRGWAERVVDLVLAGAAPPPGGRAP